MKVNMILAVVKNGIKPLLDKTAFYLDSYQLC